MIYLKIDEHQRVCSAVESEYIIEGSNIVPYFGDLGDGVNMLGKRWNGTAFEDGPEPEPIYKTLKQVGFIRLIQASGGTTQQQVLDAKGDPALAYFWLMFDMATEFERSDTEIDAGLDALVALGYLPNGKQAVLDAWPVV